MFNQFIKTSIGFTLGYFISKALNLIIVFLIIRFLDPKLFAEFDLLLTYALFGALVIMFSIDAAVARFIHDSSLSKQLYITNGFVFFHVVFVFSIIIFFCTSNYLPEIKVLNKFFHQFILLVYLNALGNLISSILRNLFRIRQFLFFLLFPSISNLTGVLFLFYFNTIDVTNYLYLIITTSFVSSIVGIFFLKKEFILSFDLNIIGELLKYSTPIYLAIFLVKITPVFQKTYIETISLSLLAIYSFSTKFMIFFSTFNQSIYSFIIPYAFKNYELPNFKKNFNDAFNFSLAFFFSLLIILSVVLPYFINSFFEKIYLGSLKYIFILSIPLCLELCYLFLSVHFGLSKKTKYYFLNDIVYFISFLIGLYFFAENTIESIILPVILASTLKLLSSILVQIGKNTFYVYWNFILTLILFLVYSLFNYYYYDFSSKYSIMIISISFFVLILFLNRKYFSRFKSLIEQNIAQ